MDEANVDLKAFTEHFNKKITGSHPQSVLKKLEHIKHETAVWLELTTLLIPRKNDSEAEIQKMTQWVVEHLRLDVPMYFPCFIPIGKY